jgi:hypothetical protein
MAIVIAPAGLSLLASGMTNELSAPVAEATPHAIVTAVTW